MRSPWCALALALGLVARPSLARAEPPAAAPDAHPFDLVRFGLWGGTLRGTHLEGQGTVARVSRPTADFELTARRYFTPRVGLDLRVLGFIVKDDAYLYGRADLGLDTVLFPWRGPTPGGITAVLGLGVDGGRYTFGFRGYPRLGLRARVHANRHATVELGAELLPLSLGIDGHVVQHRSELALAYSLFQAGFRVSHAFHTAGTPERTFMTQELALFVGVGIAR